MKRRRAPHCPSCGRLPYQYVELWRGHSIVFTATAGGRPEAEGEMEPGDPYAVEAVCRCGRTWRVRGVLQISDLWEDTNEPNANGR